jgi:hypothetical protein
MLLCRLAYESSVSADGNLLILLETQFSRESNDLASLHIPLLSQELLNS